IFFFFIVFFRIFPVPAWITLCAWLALQFFGGFSTPSPGGGGVAYWAHIGGFAAGALLTLPLLWRLGGLEFWNKTHGAPPHPEAKYKYVQSGIPRVGRR
ncbi:MAG: rhomboid family intramembrane serine protease, partial [Pseudomonadota bacterium]